MCMVLNWSIPSKFLTGLAAASGIGLIHSVANLGGFAGPYAIGIVSQKTGRLFGGLALTGLSLFVRSTRVISPEKSLSHRITRTPGSSVCGNKPR